MTLISELWLRKKIKAKKKRKEKECLFKWKQYNIKKIDKIIKTGQIYRNKYVNYLS